MGGDFNDRSDNIFKHDLKTSGYSIKLSCLPSVIHIIAKYRNLIQSIVNNYINKLIY